MQEDREWIDVTHMGSNYEINMDRYGNYRHRALSFPDSGTGSRFKVEHPWIPGHPPKGSIGKGSVRGHYTDPPFTTPYAEPAS